MHTLLSLFADLALYAHILAGSLALICFWVPVFSRKGGIIHRRIGNWYVYCMWSVIVTAVLLSINNLIVGKYLSAAFLGFLALITARPLWSGISILKNKREITPHHQRIDQFLLAAIVVAGFAMLILGYSLRQQGMGIVILIFGGLGITNLPELWRSFSANRDVNWLQEHLSGLIISGIAAHTAFLVFGASTYVQQIFSSYWATLPWFLPGVIGGIGIMVANRRFVSK